MHGHHDVAAPHKDETPGRQAEGFKGQSKPNNVNCAGHVAECKRLATLRAQLALAGWTLVDGIGGGYVASRWGRPCDLADIAAAEAFARRVGASC